MYKILLAVDGSKHSKKAIEKTIRLMGLLECQVTLLSVAEKMPIYHYGTEMGSVHIHEEMVEERMKASNEILKSSKEAFEKKNLEVETLALEGQPAETICRVAEDGKYDVIIIGSRGLGGIQQLLLGSVSNKVVNQSSVSVLVVKG